MARGKITDQQSAVLSAVNRHGGEGYGARLQTWLEDNAGLSMTLGSLYTTLDRLEAQGFVKSRLGDPTPERGGRAKRFYALTAAGVEAFEAAEERRTRIQRALGPIVWGGAK
jgi:DNA-binding PadR family transcriptional regulator